MAATTKHPSLCRLQVTIDVLPDDVLLDIFGFYLRLGVYQPEDLFFHDHRRMKWKKLVHVCQRWRCLVFQSPRRLRLEIFCTSTTPVRKMLDIWPALPLIIWVDRHCDEDNKNIIAALRHTDRIVTISINKPYWQVLPLMQEPFPALVYLDLRESKGMARVTDSLLGGSAPNLRYLCLKAIPFPALPKLLLSTTDLVTLEFYQIPHSGYFSPEAIVTALLTLTSLKSLVLHFQSTQSRPDRESLLGRPPHPTRSALPALTHISFEGVCEYFEDLVAWVDAVPLLDRLQIYFFEEPTFHTPHLSRLISSIPKFQALNEARVVVTACDISVCVPTLTGSSSDEVLTIGTSETDRTVWAVSSLAQLCNSSFSLFFTVERLYMQVYLVQHARKIENAQWLELLRPFTAVKNLYLSEEIAPRIILALLELERVTEVLPALQILLVDRLQPSGPVQEAIELFVSVRQLSNRFIAVSNWDKRWGW